MSGKVGAKPTHVGPSTTAKSQETSSIKTVTVGTEPVAKSTQTRDAWLGTGTNPNESNHKLLYPNTKALDPTGQARVAASEVAMEHLNPQLSRIRVDKTLLSAPLDPSKVAALVEQVKQAYQPPNHGKVDLCLWDLVGVGAPKKAATDSAASASGAAKAKHAPTFPSNADFKEKAGQFAELVREVMAACPDAPPGTFMVSAQNEPNRTAYNQDKDKIVTLYKDIDIALKSIPVNPAAATSLRDQVTMVAGELTSSNHPGPWIQKLVPELGKVVDGFTFHVYRHANEPIARYAARLKTLSDEVTKANKSNPPKELIVTEFGVRGYRQHGADEPGYLHEEVKGQPGHLVATNLADPVVDSPRTGLQNAEMLIAMAQTGYSGGLAWGAAPGGPQAWDSWSMLNGADQNLSPKPTFNALKLFTSAIPAGWTPEMSPTKGLPTGVTMGSWRSPESGSKGAATVLTNDNAKPTELKLDGFPPHHLVTIITYNKTGTGKLTYSEVKTDAQGRLPKPVTIPTGGAVGVTSHPSGIPPQNLLLNGVIW